jgi:hypothetical protein
MKTKPVFFSFGGTCLPDPGKKDCIIVDIDGTVANNMHRQHFMQGPKKDWKSFFNEMHKDVIFEEVRYLLRALTVATDAWIILCTGRDTDYSAQTIKWLHDGEIPFSHLVMRQAGDNRADVAVKLDMLIELRSRGYNVLFSIDDRPEVVTMWRSNGVPCFQCDAAIWDKESKSATVKGAEDALNSLKWHLENNTVNREVLFACIENAKLALKKVDHKMRELMDEGERK